jgi:hypothetical protein
MDLSPWSYLIKDFVGGAEEGDESSVRICDDPAEIRME